MAMVMAMVMVMVMVDVEGEKDYGDVEWYHMLGLSHE